MSEEGEVSNWWYLVPVFFAFIGGIVVWLLKSEDDPKKAKKFLAVGIVIQVIWIFIMVGFNI